MIQVTIRTQGHTVAEALASARTITAMPSSYLLTLDGVVRPIYKGDKEIGSLAATGNDADKLAHYTGQEPKRINNLPTL